MKEFEVIKVRTTKNENIVMFDIKINGVSIYGCMLKHVVRESDGKEFDIIQYPSYQGTNGKYYNHVYYDLSQSDRDVIINQIKSLL
jgi:hypothetical protein